MKQSILKPHQALNKAYRKLKPSHTDFDTFCKNLSALVEQTNGLESEEFHKNLVIEFLKSTYYGTNYSVNTKGRADLVIHTGSSPTTPVYENM